GARTPVVLTVSCCGRLVGIVHRNAPPGDSVVVDDMVLPSGGGRPRHAYVLGGVLVPNQSQLARFRRAVLCGHAEVNRHAAEGKKDGCDGRDVTTNESGGAASEERGRAR